ncbi:ABC transporter substrate-binding protein [Salinadaptatus halalkaliphilus]|nr:ABC transporter substrate-binding protein [Salinadaptatus halalkaliphilus]
MLAATGLAVATSGCIRRVRSVVNREEIDQFSLTITTLPADGDRESILLARAIRTALEAAGMAVDIRMLPEDEFLRTVLVNHDFDIYVGRHPGGLDPDFLYETLHSRYVDEGGWQNPFGFANLTVDDRLEAQRDADEDRESAVAATLDAIATEQPFVPICVPAEYRLVRTDRFEGWTDAHPATRQSYLGLEAASEDATLRTAHTDPRPSKNLNPLAVEYRNQGTIVDLVYDSLATFDTGAVSPWLATDWTWDDGTMTVDLHEQCQFHDGEAVTAEDVAFTYRLLADTTLGSREFTAPAPRYRGEAGVVDEVTAHDESSLELSVDAAEAVAERALLVPILPAHIWRDRAVTASLPGYAVDEGTTEAIVTDNVPPVGSGPYQFGERVEREHLTLERFDEHFTRRDDVSLPEQTAGSIRFQIDPRSTSAIELVETDAADLTSLPLESYVVDDILDARDEVDGADPLPDDVDVLGSPSWTFYHLGFNTRQAPFGNPNLRRLVARLLDKAWLVEDVFDGHARPIAAPVAQEWTPAALEWDGEDPVTPFLGTDGEVDREAATAAFEDAGFRYADDGTLRVRR